jgi:hypothetical protein
MADYEIPAMVCSWHDDVWGDIDDWLTEREHIGEDEYIVSMDIHVEAEEQIVVENVETITP